MKTKKTRQLIEAGVLIALAIVLHHIKIWTMPQGGSITAGSMVPLIILAMRNGIKWGVLGGIVCGIILFLVEGKVTHPLSILLDYIVAFGSVGLAGLVVKTRTLPKALLAAALAVLARFPWHYISGVVVFGVYAPEGQSPWLYSLLYNGTYIVPEAIVSMLLVALLFKAVIRPDEMLYVKA